jgi:hypothetical protein
MYKNTDCLNAPVRMKYQAVLRLAVLDRHFQCGNGGMTASISALRAQPITFRSNRSSTVVRYTQPS